MSLPTPMISHIKINLQLSTKSLVSCTFLILKTHFTDDLDLDNKVVKHKSPRRSYSHLPRPSPEQGVSSVVVHKQADSDVPSSTSNFRSPSIPHAISETLRSSPRKKIHLSSESDDLPCLDQPPTVYKIPSKLKHILTF